MEAALGRMISSCPNYLHADVSDGEVVPPQKRGDTYGPFMRPPPFFVCPHVSVPSSGNRYFYTIISLDSGCSKNDA